MQIPGIGLQAVEQQIASQKDRIPGVAGWTARPRWMQQALQASEDLVLERTLPLLEACVELLVDEAR